MKHCRLLVLALLLSLTSGLSAFYWPKGGTCKFFYTFEFDKAFIFNNEGTDNCTYSDYKLQSSPGTIALCFMSFNNHTGGFWGNDYDMRELTVALDDKTRGTWISIFDHMKFSPEDNDDTEWDKVFNNECEPYMPNNNAYFKYYYVQKRVDRKYDDGSKFIFINVECTEEARKFITNAGSSLALHVYGDWDGRNFDEWKYYESGQTLVTPPSEPEIANVEWEDYNNKTGFRYNIASESNVEIQAAYSYNNQIKNTDAFAQRSSKQMHATPLDWNYDGKDAASVMNDYPWDITIQARRGTPVNTKFYKQNHGYPSTTYLYSTIASAQTPVYKQATLLSVADNQDGIIALQWYVPAATGSSMDESDWVIERQIENGEVTNQRVPYSNIQSKYELNDNVFAVSKGKQTYTYNLYRAHSNGTYGPHKKVSCLVQTDYLNVTGLEAKQQGNTTQVLCSWKEIPGIWNRDDMTITLSYNDGTDTREVNITKGTTSYTLNLKPCTPYTIELQVKKGTTIVSKDCKITDFILPSGVPSIIQKLSVSKGFYNDRVHIKWSIDPNGQNFVDYQVKRKPHLAHDSLYSVLTTIQHTQGILEYSHFDNNIVPGAYYDYIVVGRAKCTGDPKPAASLGSIGFAQSYGVVSGQITYSGNQGVKDVAVHCIGQGNRTNRSLYVNGGVINCGKNVGEQIFGRQEGAMELLFRPYNESTGGYLMNWQGNLNFTVHAGGKLEVWMRVNPSGSYVSLMIPYAKAQGYAQGDFVHVLCTYRIVNNVLLLEAYANGQKMGSTTRTMTGSDKIMPNANRDFCLTENYKGWLDEIRCWNTYRDSASIAQTYNCYLSGKETGLTVYYRCDDDVTGYLFDISMTGTEFNERHLQVPSIQTDPYNIPTTEQLSLKALTDANGNYLINAIPFGANGTLYKLIPSKGVHEFAPSQKPLYFSGSSSTHNNIDFIDQSSFTVTGRVLYSNTNFPVSGCTFEVDGVICTKDGKPVLSDDNGSYSISVPIGNHTITVKKNGHVFEHDGRYPATASTTHEFIEPMTDIDFWDSTTVLVAGRVAGGYDESAKMHGFALGKANIGRAVITLAPPAGMYDLNRDENNPRVFPVPDTVACNSRTTTGKKSGDLARKITIVTDSVTGEFYAALPPINMEVTDVTIPSNKELKIDISSLGKIALADTDPRTYQTDSVLKDSVTYKRFRYFTSLDIIHYVEPTLTVEDHRNRPGIGEEFYYKERANANAWDTIPLWKKDKQGNITYTYGSPGFFQTTSYTWDISAYETYINQDNPVKPDTTLQPMRGAIVTISNELGTKVLAEKDTIVIDPKDNDTTRYIKGAIMSLNSNQILLDADGKGQYVFTADQPNVVTPYTYGVNITYQDFAKTRFYSWNMNGKFKGIVFGALTSGSNFITQGVDLPAYILRDPPGGQSTASIAKDSSFTTTVKISNAFKYDAGFLLKYLMGTKLSVGEGIGLIKIEELKNKHDWGAGMNVNGEKTRSTSSEFVSTFTQSVSTQDDIYYVASEGDLYIGESTNMLYGNARELTLKQLNDGSYVLAVQDVLSVEAQFATTFNYSQRYLEEDMLPNFEKLRNALLTTVTPAEYDTTYPAHPTKDLYITTLNPGDKGYGSSNNDSTVWGAKAVKLGERKGPSYIFIPAQSFQTSKTPVRQDMVFFYNQQIKMWKNTMAQNEWAKSVVHGSTKQFDAEAWKKAKEKAEKAIYYRNNIRTATSQARREEWEKRCRNDGCDTARLSPVDYYKGGWLIKNISFDAGATVETSSVSTQTTGISRASDHSQCGVGKWEESFAINDFGFDWELNASLGHHSNDESGSSTTQTITTKYTLHGNDFEALSVDIYQDPYGYGPIFATRGGQTYCPYEKEEKTKYYEPGKHVLHDATINMEQPQIKVDNPNQVNIPSGDVAIYTATLTNIADVNTAYSTWMHLYLDDNSNKNGAQILIDGAPLTGSGRELKMYPKQPMQMTISLKQSRTDILDYDSVAIVFSQACVPYDEADTIFLSAHFVQSCSDVTIAAKNYTLNTSTGDTAALTISGYNTTYANFASIRVQYSRKGDNNWHLVREYPVKDITTPSLYLSVPMHVPDFTDGTYYFRAVAVCAYGNDEIINESMPIVIVRDMNRPQSLGLPTPINGIYTADNEITVTLNENIQQGMIIPDNVTVKGMLNAHDLSHEVALQYGNNLKVSTEAQVTISSQAFSAELWFRTSDATTLLQHGINNGLTLQLDEARHIVVSLPDDKGAMQTYTSQSVLPKDTWTYLLLTLDTVNKKPLLNVYAAYNDKDAQFITKQPVSAYRKSAPLYVGTTGSGRMHDLMLWSKVRNWTIAKSECHRSKELYTTSVIGYWPMNEGYGTVVNDVLRHRNLSLSGESWWLSGDNHALHLTPAHPDTAMIGAVLKADENTYAMELWTRLDGDGEIWRTIDSSFIFGFKDRSIVVRVDGVERELKTDVNLGNGQWHHLTFAGEKDSHTNIYVDGNRIESSLNLCFPDVTNSAILFGKRNALDIDEVRIWSADITAQWYDLYRYCQLGDSAMSAFPGLVYYDACNIATKGRTLATTAAPLQVGRKTSSVQHTVTKSDNKLVINITEPASRIEGCILEFTVKDLIDMNGNFSEPIRWTAYVNRNQLLWSETDVVIIKENLAQESFRIDVVNNSGQVENWSITDVPEWLTFTQKTGTTQPLSETQLVVTIDPALAIGTYESVVCLTGNQGIQTPLYVSVQVTGEEPEWFVDPTQYTYSMNLIAVATKNNVSMDNEGDIVAAFMDNKVVGVAHPKYIASKDKYFVLMDIYSNALNSQLSTINFRYWDASNSCIYSNVGVVVDGKPAVSTLAFQADKVYGSTSNPVYLLLSNTLDLSVELKQGWNWTSFNVLDTSLSVTKQLAGLIPAMRQIKSNSQYAEVKDSTLHGTLTKLDYASAYKISATKDYESYISGTPADALHVGIELKPTVWNWIGYVPQMSLNINKALANLNPTEGDVIKAQTGFATWNGYEWIGSLSAMCPGEGYMYYNAAKTTQTLFYPSAAVLMNNAPQWRKTSLSQEEDQGETSTFAPVDPRTYQGNMTVTAKVMNGSVEVTDAEVGIFAGNECRAAATYLSTDSTDAGAYFILVPGNESVPLTIKVAVGGETITLEQGITFVDDAMIGSLAEPYIIQIGSAQGTQAETSETRNLKQGTSYKFLKDGILYIFHDGQVYTAEGAMVK